MNAAPMDAPVRVAFRDVSVEFPTAQGPMRVLDGVSLDIRQGEFVSIIGPSGCGKTTLLWSMAGLIRLNGGDITLDGQRITRPNPEIAMIFQDANLLPWRTVERNIQLPFELKRKPMDKGRINKLLERVGLGGFNDKYPRELSGGMQQRASIVRSLAVEPSILLMDEPFGALDAFTREQMQELLLQVWQRTAKPVFLITHDIEEAVFLASELVLLAPNPGRVVERLQLDFGQRYAAGESARAIKSDPRFIETREHVLARVFSQRQSLQERA